MRRPDRLRLHRQPTAYPPLAEGCAPLTMTPLNAGQLRRQCGQPAQGGCLYGGQSATFWAPLADLLHVSDGPFGCAVLARANLPADVGPSGVAGFAGLTLSTAFGERDVVFGGDAKLARALAEGEQLFPLNRGAVVMATCPVALIGDDIDAVARGQSAKLGKPVVAVHCAGFRRADGIADTHARIAATWRDWAAPPAARPGRYDVVLLCREQRGAWREIAELLGALGLNVVARWPAGGSRASIAELGNARLVVCVEMDYWGRLLAGQFPLPWVDANFLGPAATTASLRAIAAHFDAPVVARCEALIAERLPAAEAIVAAARPVLAGRLYLSFAPLPPEEAALYRQFGLRAGSVLQGWPDPAGVWQPSPLPRRYPELRPDDIERLLAAACPDLLDGLGQDAAGFAKRGYAVIDEAARHELTRAAGGYAGTARLAAVLRRLADPPPRRWARAPWRRTA